MKNKKLFKLFGVEVDIELLINIAMLLIPGVRIFGAIWMYNRIQRKHGFKGFKKFLLIMAAILIATGTMAEIYTRIFWPLTIAALLFAVAFFFSSKSKDREDDVMACLLGRDNCDIDKLAAALDMSDKQIARAVKSLKRQGRLPASTYIDKARRLIVLTPQGRPEYKGEKRTYEPEPETVKPEDIQQEAPERSKYDKILYQIRYINEQIDDKAMTEKIYHIENTTANIFHLVEQRPERAGEIQSFMEYYLPTTMNLLYKYSQLEKQGDINSENIQSAKRNIEGIMDKVVEGFDTQLDKLFKSDAIDITNDVKVLEKMMKMDRLNK